MFALPSAALVRADVSFREDESKAAGANLGLVRLVAVSLVKQDTGRGSVKAKRPTAA